MGGRLTVDNVYQRLFMNDSAFAGPPGNRIVVFDIHPDRIRDYPRATHILGQPDFTTRTPGAGRKKFGSGEIVIDEKYQRLFVLDSGNNRVMVFDIHPDRISNFADANVVIGQPDFKTKARGVTRNQLNLRTQFGGRPNGITLDPDRQHLYVSDSENNRIMVFDVHPERLQNGPDAIAVIGQPDFTSNTVRMLGAAVRPEERRGLKKATPGGLGFDTRYKRLLLSQPEESRILVFDMSDLKETNDPDAIAVIGQPDFETFEQFVSQSRIGWPKSPRVDSEKQLVYLSEGFEGGNRVITFDIHPDRLTNGAKAVDVIGHIDDLGRNDYQRRSANDRLNGKTGAYVRAVALDPVDHRLFAADEYNNRVLAYQLDDHNRLLERDARWVFGQKDVHTAESNRTATTMRIPLAVAYDGVDKRLYVGDSWNDRVLIYDADPEQIAQGGGHAAIAVLGQADFVSQDARTTRNRMDFAITRGRGIASSLIPVGIAIDEKRRRAFISDGGNNRVLVFDVHKDRLGNGPDALAVLGQPDFTSKRIRLSADGMNSPGHLSYDPDHDRLFVVDSLHHRVLVFDAAPERLGNGMAADRVIGQPDFTTTLPRQNLRRYAGTTTARTMPFPNGIVYDPDQQRLYVSDRANDRVLVFNAAPEVLQNYPEAIAVLGQRDAVSHSSQVASDPSGQDQLYDARGMAFDSDNQLLYVSDSHFARIMAYNFPVNSREVSIQARAQMSFNTLDAYTVLNPPQTRTGYGTFTSGSNSYAGYVITRTRLETEPLTQQLSRQLISQSAASAPIATTRSLIFVEGRDHAETSVFIANPGKKTSRLQFTLRDENGGKTTASRRLKAGATIITTITDLMRTSPVTGTLTVASKTPIAVSAWYETKNRHNEKLINTLPVVRNQSVSSNVLPDIKTGAGYETDIILFNPTQQSLRGQIILHDENGKVVQSTDYQLMPETSFVWRVPGNQVIPVSRYAVSRPATGVAPALAALIRRDDDGLITATTAESFNLRTQARISLNTLPDLIRHRRNIQTQITLANPGRIAATVRFVLRDLQGNVTARHEQIILPGMQRRFSLSTLFNRASFTGSLALASDLAIGISARLITENLRGEEILTALPVHSSSSKGIVVYPYLDGKGTSTEMIITAGDEQAVQSTLDFFDMDGRATDIIMR